MQRLLIHLTNAFVLVVILIGFPAVASRQLFNLQLSSVGTIQMVTLWGLGLAAAANCFGGVFLARDKKLRRLYLKWMLVHAALLSIEAMLFRGYINFGWLKSALVWVKEKFASFR
jgi:hypothetical protein